MTRLDKTSLVFYIALLLWFTLDLVGIPGFVTRDNLFSLAGIWEAILISILVMYLLKWKYSDLVAGAVIVAWAYLQYDSHWEAFLFGASEEWLKGYYGFFAGMYRFFPQSPTRAVPDAYHIVLGTLIMINLVLVAIKVVRFFRVLKKHRSVARG